MTARRTIRLTAAGRQASRRRGRRGAATVELAVCLPVLLTIGLGMIEVTNLVYLQARMQSAAYEATRLATRPTTAQQLAATGTQVKTYCNSLLTQLGVNGASVSVSPEPSTATPGTMVTVTVTAPWSQNSPTSFVLSSVSNQSVQTTLIIE